MSTHGYPWWVHFCYTYLNKYSHSIISEYVPTGADGAHLILSPRHAPHWFLVIRKEDVIDGTYLVLHDYHTNEHHLFDYVGDAFDFLSLLN